MLPTRKMSGIVPPRFDTTKEFNVATPAEFVRRIGGKRIIKRVICYI